MALMVPYLLGGLTAFLVADIVPLPSPSEHLGSALRAGFTTAVSAQGTAASSVNRAAKGDRGEVSFITRVSELPGMTVVQQSTSAVKPAADRRKDEARDREQARDRKPEKSQGRPPVGCDPMFSPVASPSLAHHFGLCMS